eukprot:symbB.v1.2.007844.t1/scaffold486.1/size197656/6
MGQAPVARPVRWKHSHDGMNSALDLRYGCSCMQGWRDYMEDFHFALPTLGGEWSDTAAFAVLDGHGGREVACFCQQRLPKALSKSNRRAFFEEPVPLSGWGNGTPTGHTKQNAADSHAAGKALVSAIESMDPLMMEESDYVKSLRILTGDARDSMVGASRVGCTCCMCLVQRHSIIMANVGDSRVVLCQNGLAVPLSVDHKPNLPIERERIMRAGGTVEQQEFHGHTIHRVNGNLNLSRSIGDLDYKRNPRLTAAEQVITSSPDLVEKPREKNDEFLLIASDGIWDRISNQDAVDLVLERLAAGGSRLSAITEELLDRCFSEDLSQTCGLGGDNMTAMLILLKANEESPMSDMSFPNDGQELIQDIPEKCYFWQNSLLCTCVPTRGQSL